MEKNVNRFEEDFFDFGNENQFATGNFEKFWRERERKKEAKNTASNSNKKDLTPHNKKLSKIWLRDFKNYSFTIDLFLFVGTHIYLNFVYIL